MGRIVGAGGTARRRVRNLYLLTDVFHRVGQEAEEANPPGGGGTVVMTIGNTRGVTMPPIPEEAIGLLARTIRDALAQLSPGDRTTLVEVYHRGRSAEQAARILGVPEGTVTSRLYYALRALRAAIEGSPGQSA